MAKSATTIARKILNDDAGALEELRVHEFEGDEEAHDDEAVEALYEEFSADFDRVEALLTKQYGRPSRTGKKDDKAIALNGVFRFAIWEIGNKQLYAAAAHEDRGVPILLMLGTVEQRGRKAKR